MNYDIANLKPKQLWLTSKKQLVVGIYKKTKAKFYADIEVGDVIEFSMRIKSQYNAVYITVKNLTKDIQHESSLNQLDQLKILSIFQLDDVST